MKERYEWIHSWSDEADKADLPRVLLIGDSITYFYQQKVREKLQGKYYVDYVVTSYAIDTPFYNALVSSFAKDNNYSIIHFSHGLHGQHMEKEMYEKGVENLLNEIKREGVKIILALSTKVNKAGNEEVDERWAARVAERNEALQKLAKKYGYEIDDLYTLSAEIQNELRNMDGVHYLIGALDNFADKVVESIIGQERNSMDAF